MSDTDYEFSPVVLAHDAEDIRANGSNRVLDAVSFGVPAAAASGILSIVNTARWVVGKENLQTGPTLEELGMNRSAAYYEQHQTGADVVGFIGTSLIPASWGAKILGAARTGSMLPRVSTALNMPVVRKQHYLEAALAETAAHAGSVPKILSANRARYIGWEVADKAMEATAMELAVMGTMAASPLFEGDTAKDVLFNMLTGTMLGGAFGAVGGALTSRGVLKGASTELTGILRASDTLQTAERTSLLGGTQIAEVADSFARLVTHSGAAPYSYKLDGKLRTVDLNAGGDVTKATEAGLRNAEKLMTSTIEQRFLKMADGNADVSIGMSDFLFRAADSLKAAGKDADEIAEYVRGYLVSLTRLNNIDPDLYSVAKNSFYVTRVPTESFDDLISATRTRTTGSRAYTYQEGKSANDIVAKRIEDYDAGGSLNAKEVFKANPDVDVLISRVGRSLINPASKTLRRVANNPFEYTRYMSLETGALADDAILTFGNMLSKNRVPVASADRIAAGDKIFNMPSIKVTKLADGVSETTARWAWASKLDVPTFLRVSNGIVHMDDLPMFTRLSELAAEMSPAQHKLFTLVDTGGMKTPLLQIAPLNGTVTGSLLADLFTRLDQARHLRVQKLYEEVVASGKNAPDLRVMAAMMNTSQDWVEEAIARNFQRTGAEAPGTVYATERALKPTEIELTWDFKPFLRQDAEAKRLHMTPEDAYNLNMAPGHIASMFLSKEYQIQLARLQGNSAADAVLGADVAKLFPEATALNARNANLQGAGATLGGAANADYGNSLGRFVQGIGSVLNSVRTKMKEETIAALNPYIAKIRDDAAASAELGILSTALRKNEQKFVRLPDDPVPRRLVSLEVAKELRAAGPLGNIDEVLASKPKNKIHTYTVNNENTWKFMEAHADIDYLRQDKFGVLFRATGLARGEAYKVFKPPPINTAVYKHVAFVKTRPVLGVADDVGMITAKSEDQLRAIAADLEQDFEIYYSKDTKNYFKARARYEYSMSLNESLVDSYLASKGKLGDVLPETRFENVMRDYVEYHGRQDDKLARMAVQVKYGDTFQQLRGLSEQYTSASTSVAQSIGRAFQRKIVDPFDDYLKTMLDLSKQQEFPLLDSLNDFVDNVGTAIGEAYVKTFKRGMDGSLPWEAVNKEMARYGYTGMFKNPEMYMTINEPLPPNVIKHTFQKINAALATTLLRFDLANSLVNMISTPVLLGTEYASIKELAKNNPKLLGELNELVTIAGPNGKPFPTFKKLLFDASSDWGKSEKAALLDRFERIGAIKNIPRQYAEMLDDVSIRPGAMTSEWAAKVDAAVERVAGWTFNNFAEEYTRFVSANFMKKLSDPLVKAGKMTESVQNTFILSFVNRTQGNYITSQRPVIFQGTTGAAIGLFQTYAFNVIQQLLRHMEQGSKKTLATYAALQSTAFGLNGLPFFDAVNTHLVGSTTMGLGVQNNPNNRDITGSVVGFNNPLGQWMMYGTASAFPLFSDRMPALFTRGDINPRHITVVPVLPQDVPAVQATWKLVSNLGQMSKDMFNGADVSDTLLRGLEHQGWSRPLAGLAQVASGQSTNSKGSLISAANDLQGAAWAGNVFDSIVEAGTRLAGARPMNEAVALDALYRMKSYEASDRAKLEALGRVVKSKLYHNQVPTGEEVEDLMARYARIGGRADTFSSAYMRWMRDANMSIANQAVDKLNTPSKQQLYMLMGGEFLPDNRVGNE